MTAARASRSNLVKKPRPTKRAKSAEGRIDILAYRLCDRYVLPEIERRTGVSGLSEHLKPYLEAFLAEHLPGKNILPKPPQPRRRLSE